MIELRILMPEQFFRPIEEYISSSELAILTIIVLLPTIQSKNYECKKSRA